MTTRQIVSVTLRVLCDTELEAANAADALSRIAAGLAIAGQTVDLRLLPFEHDPEEDES